MRKNNVPSFTEGQMEEYIGTDWGYWYNYCAASAGTICDEENDSSTFHDICPAGWRLPNQKEQADIINYFDEFSPVVGGGYIDGTLINSSGNAYWWSSEANNVFSRKVLTLSGGRYNGILSVSEQSYERNAGCYVRCILDN